MVFNQFGEYVGKTPEQIKAYEDGYNDCKKDMISLIKKMEALSVYTATVE